MACLWNGHKVGQKWCTEHFTLRSLKERHCRSSWRDWGGKCLLWSCFGDPRNLSWVCAGCDRFVVVHGRYSQSATLEESCMANTLQKSQNRKQGPTVLYTSWSGLYSDRPHNVQTAWTSNRKCCLRCCVDSFMGVEDIYKNMLRHARLMAHRHRNLRKKICDIAKWPPGHPAPLSLAFSHFLMFSFSRF